MHCKTIALPIKFNQNNRVKVGWVGVYRIQFSTQKAFPASMRRQTTQ